MQYFLKLPCSANFHAKQYKTVANYITHGISANKIGTNKKQHQNTEPYAWGIFSDKTQVAPHHDCSDNHKEKHCVCAQSPHYVL